MTERESPSGLSCHPGVVKTSYYAGELRRAVAKWRCGPSLHKSERSRGPGGKVHERIDSARQRCDLTSKRKRRSSSPGQSVGNDSVVSDVDSISDLDNASTLRATELESRWNVKGWMIQQNSGDPYYSDNDREHSRGRKKCRNLR